MDDIIDHIVDLIHEKEVNYKRPLLVVLIDITSVFGTESKHVLRDMIKARKIHFGRTMNSFWFSIYDKNNLL